jgi:hypothetical protein
MLKWNPLQNGKPKPCLKNKQYRPPENGGLYALSLKEVIMKQVPRILHWANMIHEINRVSRDGSVFMVQSKENCAAILKVRSALYAIYLEFWSDKDIGYPATLEILKRWSVDATEPVQNPVKYLRNLKLFVMSIDLDMLSVDFTMEDKEELDNASQNKTAC